MTRAAADVGGTFTDVIVTDADGGVRFSKVLSTPPAYDRARTAVVTTALDEEKCRDFPGRLREAGVESVAVWKVSAAAARELYGLALEGAR